MGGGKSWTEGYKDKDIRAYDGIDSCCNMMFGHRSISHGVSMDRVNVGTSKPGWTVSHTRT